MNAFHLRRRVNGGPGYSGGDLVWLLRDEFSADAASLANPRVAVPGPGQWVTKDTGSVATVSGGSMPLSGITGAADPVLTSGPYDRVPGRAIIAEYTPLEGVTQRWAIGWAAGSLAVPSNGAYFAPSVLVAVDNGPATAISAAHVTGTPYRVAAVMQTARVLVLVKGGVFTAWTLFDVPVKNPLATAYASLAGIAATTHGGSQNFARIRDTALTDAIATLNLAAAVSGTLYAGLADVVADLVVTAPAVLANTCELRFRVVDDSNYLQAIFTAAGAFQINSVVAGTPTNYVNVAGVIAGGGTVRARIYAHGTSVFAQTLSGTTWTARGAVKTITELATATGIKPVAGVGWTLGELFAYPRTSGMYDQLDRV